jgi:hypothetical protein
LQYDGSGAFYLAAQSRVADSAAFDDDRTAASVAAVTRTEEHINTVEGVVNYQTIRLDDHAETLGDHAERIAALQNGLAAVPKVYVQQTAPNAADVPEGSLWAW